MKGKFKLLFTLFITVLMLAMTMYFASAETICVDLKVNSSLVSSSENNFVLPVSLLRADLNSTTSSNIAFYDNNSVLLPFEIEYFNQSFSGSLASLVAWVKIPVLDNATKIKLCYGLEIVNLSNRTGTW
jgi:hypothetical protein